MIMSEANYDIIDKPKIVKILFRLSILISPIYIFLFQCWIIFQVLKPFYVWLFDIDESEQESHEHVNEYTNRLENIKC